MDRDKEFDIVVWGATGSTGRRVAHHMAVRNPGGGDLCWALGGRNQSTLEAVRSQLGAGAKDIAIVTADSHDASSLDAMVARTHMKRRAVPGTVSYEIVPT